MTTFIDRSNEDFSMSSVNFYQNKETDSITQIDQNEIETHQNELKKTQEQLRKFQTTPAETTEDIAKLFSTIEKASNLGHKTGEIIAKHDKDYNMVKEFVHLFLAKENDIHAKIRETGNTIGDLHQVLGKLISLSNYYNEEELPEDAKKIIENLEGLKINLPFAEGSKKNSFTLSFGKMIKDGKFNKESFRSSVSTNMEQVRLAIQQWFTTIQSLITQEMTCCEIVKAALRQGDMTKKTVENQTR